jgi:stearoyl-CoA desaturase (Delta-9 desaturase)
VSAVAVLLAVFTARSLFVTVLYHRALSHGGLALGPGLRRLVAPVGLWLTGADARAWICLDRVHHVDSERTGDGPRGLVAALRARRAAYRLTLARLRACDPAVTRQVDDLRLGRGLRPDLADLPHAVHAAAAVVLALVASPAIGAGFLVGLLAQHVVFVATDLVGHRPGRARFATAQPTSNRRWLALLSFGEALQNGHHRFPRSARFGLGGGEVDLGYLACRAVERLGLGRVQRGDLLSVSAARVVLPGHREAPERAAAGAVVTPPPPARPLRVEGLGRGRPRPGRRPRRASLVRVGADLPRPIDARGDQAVDHVADHLRVAA